MRRKRVNDRVNKTVMSSDLQSSKHSRISQRVHSKVNFLRRYWFQITIIVILILSAVLRLYNFQNRWGLAADQARDAIVGRIALKESRIPLLGPFSSAGNFTTGPLWYWFVMAATAVYPPSILTPWIVLSLIYILIVYAMIRIGYEIGDKPLGVLTGLLTAFSPAQITQSTNLTNPSGVSIFSVLALYLSIIYIKRGNQSLLFFLSFCIASAVQFHFQAVNLLVLIPVVFFFKRPTLKSIGLCIAGGIIPFVPLILFDITHGLHNYRGIMDYLLYGQYKIYVPNRWLTYLGVFWPNLWSFINGGYPIIGYGTLFVVAGITTLSFFKRNISKPLASVLISFFIIIIILRFYRGERYNGYFIFIHPFVLLLTSWTLYKLYEFKKIAGIILTSFILFGGLISLKNEMLYAYNYSSKNAEYWVKYFDTKFPNEKLSLYSPTFTSVGFHFPLILFLEKNNKLDSSGHKISLGKPPDSEIYFHTILRDFDGSESEYWDINSSSSAELSEKGWGPVNASDIYKDTVEWYAK